MLEELEDETRSREALERDLEAETKMKLDLSILLEDIQNENKALLTKVEAAESEVKREHMTRTFSYIITETKAMERLICIS